MTHGELIDQSGQDFSNVINEQYMEKEKMDAAWEAVRQQHEALVNEGAQDFFSNDRAPYSAAQALQRAAQRSADFFLNNRVQYSAAQKTQDGKFFYSISFCRKLLSSTNGDWAYSSTRTR